MTILPPFDAFRTKGEVDQQSAESAHSLQMSELQMQCSARIEDFRQKYEADLHSVRAELNQAVAVAQGERTKYENEINGTLHTHDTVFFVFL